MWGVLFNRGLVHNFRDAQASDLELFRRYYQSCLDDGVFFAPSAFEVGFVSTAHTKSDLEETVGVVECALDTALENAE